MIVLKLLLLMSIEGVGTVCLSHSLSILDVLFVPTLNCNLLSVSKLTKSCSCVALFYPTHYLFQTIHSKEKIGSVERVKDCIIWKMSHNKPIKEHWFVLRMNTYKIKTKGKYGYGIDDWDIPLLVI